MMVQKFEYIDDFDLICLCCFDSYFDPSVDDQALESQFIIQKKDAKGQIYSKSFRENEKPCSIKQRILNQNEVLIFVGTSISKKDDKSHVTPDRGNLHIFQVSKDQDGNF